MTCDRFMIHESSWFERCRDCYEQSIQWHGTEQQNLELIVCSLNPISDILFPRSIPVRKIFFLQKPMVSSRQAIWILRCHTKLDATSMQRFNSSTHWYLCPSQVQKRSQTFDLSSLTSKYFNRLIRFVRNCTSKKTTFFLYSVQYVQRINVRCTQLPILRMMHASIWMSYL